MEHTPSTARLDESFRASSRQADALALVNYREPDEADVKGFSMAFGTTENFWEVLGHEGEEERAQRFNRAMRAVSLNTLDVIPRMYPFDRIRGDGLLVDVGGGLGQVARAIMGAHRGAGLRSCIVQDAHAGDDAKKQPDVMEANRELGVELQKHNFFDPQPVKGMLQICPLSFPHRVVKAPVWYKAHKETDYDMVVPRRLGVLPAPHLPRLA